MQYQKNSLHYISVYYM